jgi:hypothetical protein
LGKQGVDEVQGASCGLLSYNAHLVHFWFWNPKAEFWIFFHMETNQISNAYNAFLSVDGFHCLKCDMRLKYLLIYFLN